MFNAATLEISPYRLHPHSIDQSGEDASQVDMSCAISIACRSMLMKKCATLSITSFPHNSTSGKPNILGSRTNTANFQAHPDASPASQSSHTLASKSSKSRIGEVEVILDTKLVPQRQSSVETCGDNLISSVPLQQKP